MTVAVTRNLALLSAAPGGIKALRQLIFDLAIAGRLLPQQDSDQPAEAVLIATAAIRSSATARRSGSVRGSVRAERLPSGWVATTVGDVLVCRDGERVPVSQADRETRAKVYDYYGASGVIDKIDGFLFDKPLLLVGEDGANLINRSTPIAFIARGRYWVNNHAHVLDGIDEDLLRYMALYFNAIDLKPYVTGTAQPKLNQAKLNAIPVSLPPQAEQHRIVAKVDELMALCDRLEARQQDAEAAHARLVQALLDSLTQARDADELQACWQRAAEQFDTVFTTDGSVDSLKQTVMQLGVEGRLCAGGPRSAWQLKTINEFCTVQGGIQKTPLRAPVQHHFPYLRVANVQRGRIDVAQLERYELAPDELERWRLNAGDLLIVEGNGSETEIGRCAIWHGEVDDCVYQNHLMRVRPTGDDAVEFLALYLNSPVGTAHMRRLAITTSGLFNLSVGKIRSIPVELPPPAEQRRIVAKVTELLALCDQLKARITAARAKHAQLAEALVAEAVA